VARAFQLQWGHRLSTVDGNSSLCALVFQLGASMGPPSLNGGWLAEGVPDTLLLWWLQWGHRLSTVDGSSQSSHVPGGNSASMGPPSLNGGWRFPPRGFPPSGWLQWGHRLSTVDGSPTSR